MATSTSDTAFLTLEKSFSYRGAREHFQNVYHLDIQPPSTADWSALADAVWNIEKGFQTSDVQLEWAYGHNPGTPPTLVWERDYAPVGEGGLPGSLVPAAGDVSCPGDVAAWIRYGTTQKSKLGKPIYLRNYYHSIYHSSGAPDTIAANQKAGLESFGTAFVNGFSVNGLTYRRAGPRGAVAQNHVVSQWATTRTLKKRGKRKKTVVTEIRYMPIGSTPIIP